MNEMRLEVTERDYAILITALTVLFDKCAKDKSPMKNEIMELSSKFQKQLKPQRNSK